MSNVKWIDLPFDKIDKRDSLNICKGCVFKQEATIGFAPFEIVGDKPEIIFVAEAPFKDEMKKQRPLIGKAGKFLREVIDSLGLKSYALANIVCCHPTKGSPKPPPQHAQDYCVAHVKEFIRDVQPKLVILLGKIAYMNLLPQEYLDAQLRNASVVTRMQKLGPYQHEGIKYACSFHPSYLARNGGLKSPQYKAFELRLKSLIRTAYQGTDDFQEDKEGDTLDFDFYTLDQLPQILNDLQDIKTIGFDYEAKTLDTWNVNNTPTGFALAHVTGLNSGKAYYVIIDRKFTNTEKDLLVAFLIKKIPWTYNAKFEANLTWSNFGKFIRLNDAFTLCKIDGKPQSLKVNSQLYLGSELWEEDVFSIVEYFKTIFETMMKYKEKFPDIVTRLQAGDYYTADELANADTKALKAFSGVLENVNVLTQSMGEEAVIKGLRAFPYQWAAVPARTLGEYCCWDAYNTVKLKEELWDRYSQYYKYYISQTWLAGTMEAYGIVWDDAKATELNKFYMEEALRCLIDLIDLLNLPDEKIMEAHQIANDPSFTGSANARLAKIKKMVFNPLSNKPEAQEPFWSAFKTEEVEGLAMFQSLESAVMESPGIDDDLILPLIDKTDLDGSLVSIVNALEGDPYAADAFATVLGGLNKNVEFHMKRFAAEILEFHYRSHTKYGGANIDDPKTWSKQFKMLYLLKRFKKVCKSDSTYIWGSVGRGNVHLSKFNGILDPPRRIGGYYELGGEKYELKDDERWVLNTNFFENGAISRRWKSSIHVIPSMSELREIYVPRTDTSIIVHFDYKQMEVRTLAAMCNETNMMDAFARGVDIHKFVASRIWKIPEDAVTPSRRRFAKAATFSILYGKGVAAFAHDFMNGDLAAAKKFFQDFFSAFPKVLDYIKEQHKKVLATGKVHTIFGDPLVINVDRIGIPAAKRAAQNWVIQSLNGNTPIALLNGESVTIQEMVKRSDQEYYGWAVNKNTSEYVPVRLESPQLTGYKNDWIRVTLDDGQVFETTTEHLWITRSGKEVRADQLKVNDSLMPLYLTGGNYKNIPQEFNNGHKYPVFWKVAETFHGECPYDETANRRYDTHHIDKNPLNNTPHNLEYKTSGSHLLGHHVDFARQFLGLSDNVSDDEAIASLMAYKNTNREKLYPKWHQNQKSAVTQEVNQRYKETGSVLGISDPKERSHIHSEKVWSEKNRPAIIAGLIKGHNKPESIAAHSKASEIRESNLDYKINRIRKAINLMDENSLSYSTAEEYDISLTVLCELKLVNSYSIKRSRFFDGILEWDKVLEKLSQPKINHKVAKVERIHYEVAIPTYDISVPDYLNFAIGYPNNGVFVHNSSASSMAGYAIWILYEKIKLAGLKASPICFTHDSSDWDIEIEDLFKFLPIMYDVAVGKLKKDFGIPADIDWEVGIHQNFMMELEKKGDSLYHFSCPKNTFHDIIGRLQKRFTVSYDITGEEITRDSESDLFLTKRAFSQYLGEDIVSYEGTLEIVI